MSDKFIPRWWADAVLRDLIANSPFPVPPLPPLTARARIRGVLSETRYRLTHAVRALRGIDCD